MAIIFSRFKKLLFSSQLRLNMLSGSAAMALGILISAAKYPLYIHFLGYEKYGVWLLLSIIVTFSQMGLIGIGPAVIKLVAEEYENKNERAIQEYLVTALILLVAFGGFVLACCILFKWQIIQLTGLVGENGILAGGLLIYMAIFSTGVLAYQVLNSVLAGVGRIDQANYSQTALQFFPLLVSTPLLMLGKGVISLLLANSLAYILIFMFNLFWLNKIVKVNIFAISSFSWSRLNKMLAFGGNVFAGSVLNMLIVPIAKVVVTRTVGIEGVTVFELAYRVSMQVRNIFEVALRALMPEISKLTAGKSLVNKTKIKLILSKSYAVIFFAAGPLYLFIFIFTPLIFKTWLGANFIPTISEVFRVMLFVSFVSLLGVIQYYVNMGSGRVRIILIHHILCAIGTLLSLGVAGIILPDISNVVIAWCFLPGTLLGTCYLLIGHCFILRDT